MKYYPFIFSSESKYRLKRHFVFWVSWWVFMGFLYAFVPVSSPFNYWERIPRTMLDALLFLPAHMFLSYSLMYFVIPVYVVKNKWVYSALWTLLIILLTACISAFIAIYLTDAVAKLLLPGKLSITILSLSKAKSIRW